MPITLQVGVKAFLKNPDGKFLLLKRSPEKYPGTRGSWDIVGGRIEIGTKLLDNLKREVTEETGLEIIGEPKLIFAQDIILDKDWHKGHHVVRLTYLADTKGEPILDMSENIEYRWLSLEEIKKQDDLDIYVKEIIEKGMI